MTSDRVRRLSSSSKTVVPSTDDADVEAIGRATAAMMTAAEALNEAATVFNTRGRGTPRYGTGLQDGKSYSRLGSFTQEREPLSDQGHLTSNPHFSRPSSSDRKANLHRVQSTAGALDRYPVNPPRSNNHVDLLEAVARLRQSSNLTRDKPTDFTYVQELAGPCIGGSGDGYITHGSILDDSATSHPVSAEMNTHPPPMTMSMPHEICFLALICTAQFLCQSGLTMTIPTIPLITPTFPASNSSTWYTAAYSLTLGTFILPSGRFGDVYGHKKLFVIGWIWYSFWSVLAGFSLKIQDASFSTKGEIFFISCRAFQGIGPAILMPNGIAFLGRTYGHGPKKNMVFALFAACAPIGAVAGAGVNTLVAQRLSWEWEFWILSIFTAFLALVTLFIVPGKAKGATPVPNLSWKRRWMQLDGTGSCVGVVGLILLNVSLNQAPLVGWHTPYAYFLLIISLIFLVLFFLWQSRASNTTPLIPPAALTSTTVSILACVACGWSAFGIWIFYTWSFIISERQLSPLHSCLWLLPAPIAGLCASIFTGIGLHRLGAHWIMLVAMCAFFTGSTVMATIGTTSGHWIYWSGVFISVVIMPFGMDMSFPSATILLSDTLGHGQQGVAASLVNTVVNYSISLGLGISGTVVRELVGGDSGDGSVGQGATGYKDALYSAMGTSGLGIIIATCFVGSCVVRNRRSRGRVLMEKDAATP